MVNGLPGKRVEWQKRYQGSIISLVIKLVYQSIFSWVTKRLGIMLII